MNVCITTADETSAVCKICQDLGRQYIVQYMIQSEAGFYLQGMRLHAFQVTKLSYYFAAFIFALFSQSWA